MAAGSEDENLGGTIDTDSDIESVASSFESEMESILDKKVQSDNNSTEDESDIEQPSTSTKPKKRRKLQDSALFDWKKIDLEPKLHTFDDNSSGCAIQSLPEDPSPLEIFENLISLEFVKDIATQSNMYYAFLVSQDPSNIIHNYKEILTDEIYLFLAISL